MAEEVLRDRSGRIIGRIREVSGFLELRDSNNCILGRYYPQTNQTRDRDGKLVGTGNLLGMLIATY